MGRPRFCLLALLAMLALPATVAWASPYTTVLAVYEQTGKIPSCRFSSRQLTSALKGVDTYGAQYFADFTNAVQTALTARASGACSSDRALRGALAADGGQASKTAPLGSVTAATSADIPAPIALMAVLAGLCTLIATIGGVARMRGSDPAVLAAWRHAWGEAGYRAGGTWSEFRDWLRPN